MNTEEKLLRENIRKAIKIVQKRKEDFKRQALLEESKPKGDDRYEHRQ